MRFAYKVISNNNKDHNVEYKKETAGVASFIMVSKNIIAFRECAKIMDIAKETGCYIELASGKKSGNSDSILSLVSLGIVKDKSFVLTIKGDNSIDAFHKIAKIINDESLS